MENKRIIVLISAYACEPHKGSEPGVGWNWAKQIAKFAEAWVITRANNKEVIEEELSKNPDPNLHFIYVDLPKWMKFWKRGQRGVHLYYLLWQCTAYVRAKKLTEKVKFDLAHHITFVNDWTPTFLALLDMPLIWGPIGSNIPIPKQYLTNTKSYLKDRIKHYIRKVTRSIMPFYKRTINTSRRIILISKSQLGFAPFNSIQRGKLIFQPANAVDVPERNYECTKENNRDSFRIFSAGTLIPIKGFHLSLQAVADLNKKKEITFIIAGSGSWSSYLKSFAHELDIEDKVVFAGNLQRSEVLNQMHESDIFLFPSFEGGGMVVLEAMAAGLPVVCLDYGGPGEMVTDECGIKVKPIIPDQTIKDLSDALLKLANDPELRKKMGQAGRKRVEEHYTWEKKGEVIRKVYEEVLDEHHL